MIEVGLQALWEVLQPSTFLFLVLGVVLGSLVGFLPGLGGVTGMSLVLPFVLGMDPTAALALLLGLMAVTQTGDTFPSVLIGVPGSASAQATIMDGYPLARRGRGEEALASAFTASMLGGLVGALCFLALVFAARPMILAFGSPQLLMLTFLGLSMVAILSQGAARAGLLMGALGLLLGSVGAAPTAPVHRFAFDLPYLYDGIPLTALGIGLFAIPELLDLLIRGQAIAEPGTPTDTRGQRLAGIRATFRHKWLVLRSSLIGMGIGALPGLGGSVADWITYGIARQTSKGNETFGKGDIRGVIAPESSNNAKEGGALLPTLLFGIPGSGSMAMLLGAFAVLQIQPGPRLVADGGSTILSMAWILAIANVLATGLALGLSRRVAKLTLVPARSWAPFLFVMLALASYQATRHWGDLIAIFAIGAAGWVVKQIGWPRPPLLVGFVLATSAERYLATSTGTYGLSWLWQPFTLAIGAVIFGLLVVAQYVNKRARLVPGGDATEAERAAAEEEGT